jgi:hypothetical protein
MDDFQCFVDGAPTLHRGEDSIQIYLNITTLINLNAFGVAGMNVLIYLLTSDHVY